MKLNLKKLGRRLLEPSTMAGAGGVPIAGVLLTIAFPQHADKIALGGSLLAGVLIGHKPKKTFQAEQGE